VASFIVAVLIVLATVPLTMWGLRMARRHRRVAFAATSLLLLFGVNFTVDPPPPPRVEASDPDREQAKDDEPR
jgi:hypothetical protein